MFLTFFPNYSLKMQSTDKSDVFAICVSKGYQSCCYIRTFITIRYLRIKAFESMLLTLEKILGNLGFLRPNNSILPFLFLF